MVLGVEGPRARYFSEDYRGNAQDGREVGQTTGPKLMPVLVVRGVEKLFPVSNSCGILRGNETRVWIIKHICEEMKRLEWLREGEKQKDKC